MRGRTCAALLALLPSLLAGRAAARDTVEKMFQKTLPLPAGRLLTIEHANGDIVVKTHAVPELRVHAVIRVTSSNEEEARSFADEIHIEAEAEGGGAVVRTRYPERLSFRNFRISYSVDYDILMPEGASLMAKNRFGSVSVSGVRGGTTIDNANGRVTLRAGGGLQRVSSSFGAVEVTGAGGDVDITNGNGDVTVADVKGSAELRTRFGKISASKIAKSVTISGGNGDVTLADCGPATVRASFSRVDARNIAGALDVQNSNGAVDASNVTGAASLKTSFGAVRFTDVGRAIVVASNAGVTGTKAKEGASVHTSFGPIELSDVGGTFEVEGSNSSIKARGLRGSGRLKTSFGPVDADDVGGDLEVENSNGSVTAHGVKGSARVKTSFGSVTLGGVGGEIQVDDSNGSIDVRQAARASGECRKTTLKTSFGTVKAQLPEGLGYTVDARTSFGSIESELPVAGGQQSGNVLTGKIGDGRCPLTVVNSNGRINLVVAR
jgi:DUF4097 and DUF4098 domain-containing protein YvlB